MGQAIGKKTSTERRNYSQPGVNTPSNNNNPGRNTPSVLGEQLERAYLIDVGVLLDAYGDWKQKKLRGGEVEAIVGSLVSSSLVGFAMGLYGDKVGKNIVSSILGQLVSSKLGIWFYDFRINPQQVTISDKKLQTHTEYGWGYYDLEYFGNSFTTLTVRGTSGILLPDRPILNMGFTNIQLSVGYAKFEILRKFYMNSDQRLMFILFGKGYFGFLENFEFTLDAENPRRIDYSFTFRAHPVLVFDLYSMDFSGIKNLGHLLDPKSVKLTTMSNSVLFSLFNGRP
jgi:hypothetical protein